MQDELNKEAIGPVGLLVGAGLTAYALSQRKKRKKTEEELEVERNRKKSLTKRGELTMWQKSFKDEIAKLAVVGYPASLPTNQDAESVGPKQERNLPTNREAETVQPGIERNLPTNQAAEAVQSGIERNLPINNADKLAQPTSERDLPTNYGAYLTHSIKKTVGRNLATN